MESRIQQKGSRKALEHCKSTVVGFFFFSIFKSLPLFTDSLVLDEDASGGGHLSRAVCVNTQSLESLLLFSSYATYRCHEADFKPVYLNYLWLFMLFFTTTHAV